MFSANEKNHCRKKKMKKAPFVQNKHWRFTNAPVKRNDFAYNRKTIFMFTFE